MTTWTQDNDFLILFVNLDTVLWNSTPQKKIQQNLKKEALYFETAWIKSLRGVFAIVLSSLLKLRINFFFLIQQSIAVVTWNQEDFLNYLVLKQ